MVGVFVAIVIFGFRWFDRKQDSSDKRADNEKEIMMQMVNINQIAFDRLDVSLRAQTEYLKKRNGSVEKHMDNQDNVHKEILKIIKEK